MSELRKRAAPSGATKDEQVDRMIKAAASGAPPAISQMILRSAPAIQVLVQFINIVGPIIVTAFQFLHSIYEKLPFALLQALMGLSMCFFGGAYTASIAAAEAFAITGWETTKSALNEVYGHLIEVAKANEADDKKDEDGDGVPDAQQVAASALLERKARVAMIAIKDPAKLTEALGGLYSGWIAVQGTLRIEFAKTVTLGVSIANMLEAPALRYGVPVLIHVIPSDFRHWIPTLVRTICKAIAVSVAWYLQTIISAFHSAMRGGLLLSRSLLKWANENGHLTLNEEDTYLDELIGYSVAALGFYTQWMWGFGLPFPFNIVMLPFTLLEWYIRWSVTS
jgi:hypothetical protein